MVVSPVELYLHSGGIGRVLVGAGSVPFFFFFWDISSAKLRKISLLALSTVDLIKWVFKGDFEVVGSDWSQF